MIEKLNEWALRHGAIGCYICRRTSGVYHISIEKRFVCAPSTKKLVKVYVCEDCLEEGVHQEG